MQPNQIILPVNVDNDDGTTPTVPATFTRFNFYQNRSEYIEESHTMVLRDKVGLYRSFAKPNGNFKGVAKTAIKFTRDVSVPGVDSSTSIVAPSIIDIGFSHPIGMTPALMLEQRMRAVALLSDDSIMTALCLQLMI